MKRIKGFSQLEILVAMQVITVTLLVSYRLQAHIVMQVHQLQMRSEMILSQINDHETQYARV